MAAHGECGPPGSSAGAAGPARAKLEAAVAKARELVPGLGCPEAGWEGPLERHRRRRDAARWGTAPAREGARLAGAAPVRAGAASPAQLGASSPRGAAAGRAVRAKAALGETERTDRVRRLRG